MQTSVSLLALLLVSLCICPQLAAAHSNGAGQCVSGEASVSDTHLTSNTVTTGKLSDGGFTMQVSNSQVNDGALMTVGPLTFDFEISVSGNREFKGVLIMLTDVYDTDANIVLKGDESLQAAENCPEQVAVTHKDASPKSSVAVTLSADEEVVADVDITVVVQNSNRVSEYYYSSFKIQLLNQYLPNFFGFCVEQLLVADEDNNLILNKEEYFNFITLLGQESKCYTPSADGQLTDVQNAQFESLACTICIRNDVQDPAECCVDPTEIPIANADDTDNATSLERRHLSSICQFTYADIPPSCGSN